jgi:hypothetical protein
MSSPSPRAAVRAGSIAVAALSFGSGVSLAAAVQKLALQDYTWFLLYLLVVLILILSAVVNVRRMLKAVPY